jgi:cyclase
MVLDAVSIPVIASGGAGSPLHFLEVFRIGADAALAAGIFHRGEYRIREIKEFLKKEGVQVRL